MLSKPVPPAILGHEFSGLISEVGDSVNALKVGDRVSAQPQVYCGDCEFCQRGSPNMCTNKTHFTKGGSWAEYIVVNQRSVFLIPRGRTAQAGCACPSPWAVRSEPWKGPRSSQATTYSWRAEEALD